MGALRKRKKGLTIRKIRKGMKYANKVCHEQISKLNCSKKNCSCPECRSKEHVKNAGSNRDMKKFVCTNPCHEKRVCFSTSTSYEAVEIYRNCLTEILCLLVQTNAMINGITRYNETSKYFVELALEGMCEFVNKEAKKLKVKIDKNADLVTIFLDISGSGLARNKAIILARVEGKTIFDIITVSNYLSSYKILAAIKKKLQISHETKLVFVTDGESCFVDAIKHLFPDSIHVRQFHSRSCRGIIYIHLKYGGKDYTIRCLWDSVLNEGTPSEDVMKKRELKSKKKASDKKRITKVRYSELSKDVMIWEGTVYAPRGIRRKLPENGKNRKTKRVSSSNNTSTSDASDLPLKKINTLTPDTPVLLFQGSLNEAKKLEVAAFCFQILKKIFAGLYITSNTVETVFNVKSKLYPHRTMKSGERMMICVLYSQFVLKGKSNEELRTFFKENIITYDFITQKVLYGSGLQKNKQEPPSFLNIIQEAVQKGKRLVIHYCDRNHKHTSRVIAPLEIKVNPYNNTTLIESFCSLRNEKRTFYLERIRDVIPYETNVLCF
jgi:transposase-like protein